MTSLVVLFAYSMKLKISTRNGMKGVTKILPKLYCYDLPNANNKMVDKISFHNNFTNNFVVVKKITAKQLKIYS